MQRLRSLAPAWPLSRSEARWVTQQQAALLISTAGVTGPPVPERIAVKLDGVHVYRLDHMPARGLLSASRPSREGGDILIDATAPPEEQRVALMHELKHIIDGGHTTKRHQAGSRSSAEGLCIDFAMSVLIPASWLRDDWQAGHRSLSALAERYQVPEETIEDRLHSLGLVKTTPRRHRPYCQWPHAKNAKATTSGETFIAMGEETKGGNNP
jgi:Zn-dependent peptidase ImmA (M78 family)